MKYITNISRILFFALFLLMIIRGRMILWFALFALSLIGAAIFGRIYCGYACPMNTLMIPAEWLSRKLKLHSEREPEWIKGDYWGWVSLLTSIVVMVLSKKIFHLDLPILAFWLILSVVFALRYKPESFHNRICPFGVLQKAFGRIAKNLKKVNKDICIGCERCESVCPSEAIEVSSEEHKAAIKTNLCHQCSNCKAICPVDAIYYGK